MTLTIELPPEIERRLTDEAARYGQAPEEFARAVLEERLAPVSETRQREAQIARNQQAIALLRQWSQEDAADPDPNPVPAIPPVSLREVKVD